MAKKIIALGLLVVLGVALGSTALAIGELPPETIPTNITSGAELVELIKQLINWLFVGFLLTAVVLMIIAAFQFLTGGGDPSSLASAKGKLIWAVVAVIIAVLARAIPLVVENIVTATS